MLASPVEVIRCLVTYTDWYQPQTTSLFRMAAPGRGKGLPSDGMRPGFAHGLDERIELERRLRQLSDRDRHILFLWYVAQLPADEIAQVVGISRRQCFRIRGKAIQSIVEAGEPGRAA